MLVSALIDRIRRTLIDTATPPTWTDAQLLDYLSAAEVAVVNAKPDAYTKVATVTLAAGVDQVLPDDGLSLLKVLRNASGQAVRNVAGELLDAVNPSWAANTPMLVINEYTTDSRVPRRYWVNPPSNGSSSVVLMYGAIPPAITDIGSNSINLPDNYQHALWAHVVAQALAENTKRQDLVKSREFMGWFTTTLGLRQQGAAAVAPKLDLPERS